ncbi:hypothetical protein [Rubellicoccus peritrichatus]|uniref:Uncharacterized protein n=1 Tax=Rubellicoccus peritrichatus TaxID=3080537 RepID=A0AAQ3QRZ3_9BACT|nr:hypothetical protein [Puniceicoccus sp. CR14]WOO41828.1 hypothetical protein RZN69_01920 [Puniceicoccus sp. CR14]
MKKLKKNELHKAVKKFLRKKNLKQSDYQVDFVEKTCTFLTNAFNKTYDVSNAALDTVEEQLSQVHDAIFREENEAKAATKVKKKSAKKATKKTASKKVARKKVAKKAVKKAPAKKAVRKTVKKAAKKVVKKTAAKKTVAKKAAARKRSAS